MTISNDVYTPVTVEDKLERTADDLMSFAVKLTGKSIRVKHEQEEWHLLWAYDEIEDRHYKWKWWLTMKRSI